MLENLPAYAWALPLLAIPVLYAIWSLARRVVRWGFFIFYAVVGGSLSQLALLPTAGSDRSWPYSIAAGISFACVCAGIRARIMKVVGILFVAAVVAMVGWQFYVTQH